MELNDQSLFREKCYIDGAWVDAGSGKTIEVNDPDGLEGHRRRPAPEPRQERDGRVGPARLGRKTAPRFAADPSIKMVNSA